uniref:Uncharacterized protein n=1 Tax=Globisporangium ultimum (strain ATCC 200006 / CBS 805.95 / DAOM BR144) TaxID=431595 RepID=K3WQJ7_GLOUD
MLLLTQCQAARVNDATGSDQVSPKTKTLRVEASPVVQLQLRSQDSHDAAKTKDDFDDSDDAYGWDDDIFDDDSDSNSDDDMLSFLNPHPEPQATKLYEFTLGRRWHVYPATEQGVSLWAFQIAVSLPGQTFVHILKDDPDYKDERNRYKHGDNMAPIAKIVAESNDSVLLNDLNVFETAQGWSVSSTQDVTETPTARRIDDLVVHVYLNRKEYKSQQLKSLVSTGAGDVIVYKKVLPRSALSLQIASRGNGSMFLQSSSSLSCTSLVFETIGNSSLYARLSGLLSVRASMYLSVDGTSSIGIDADRISASMVTATATDTADICVSARRLSVGATLNATVVGDGSIAMFADRGQSSMETIVIDGSGKVDTSTVSSISTDVTIHGGSASANVQSVFRLSYDVPPGSHVRYRGRSPMTLTRTTGSPPLEKLDSSSTSAKCRAAVIPDEPKAGRFPPLESPDSQSPDAPVYLTLSPKTTAASPSSIFTTGESLTTPEVDEAIDKANDKVARAEAKTEAATPKRIRADNSANPYFSANTSTYMAIYASSNTANNSHTSGNARANSRSNINANADQCGYANYDSHDEHNSRRIQPSAKL